MTIFDLHCDTATELYHRALSFDNSETHLRAETVKGHRVTQCFAVFLDDPRIPQRKTDFFRAVAKTVSELSETDLTPILTAEGVGALAEEDGWIDLLADTGCRMASPVWNGKNSLATGAVTDDRAPLTEQGKEAVSELIARNIYIDVSHLSAVGTDEILSLTSAPIVASHSDARSVCDHPRNLTDGTAREIFRRNGLVGLNLYPPFLTTERATIDDVLHHAERFLSLGGEHGLALGCDFDGVDHLPDGISDFSDLPKLYTRFSAEFGTSVADGIFYENASRFFGREKP